MFWMVVLKMCVNGIFVCDYVCVVQCRGVYVYIGMIVLGKNCENVEKIFVQLYLPTFAY